MRSYGSIAQRKEQSIQRQIQVRILQDPNNEVISPHKRKIILLFSRAAPMTSSPDNNNIPLKNFLAKPRKNQREDCCYIAETEIANTNQLSTQTLCFCPWCQEGSPFAAPTTA